MVIAHRHYEFYETRKGGLQRGFECWYAVVGSVEKLAELKSVYPRTDYVGNDRYIQHQVKYKLLHDSFQVRTVYILFVGTHEKYDKIDCSTI